MFLKLFWPATLTVNPNDSLLWFGSRGREWQALNEAAEAVIISLNSHQYRTIRDLESNYSCASYYLLMVCTFTHFLSFLRLLESKTVCLFASCGRNKRLKFREQTRKLQHKPEMYTWLLGRVKSACVCHLTWAPYTYLSSIFPPNVWPPMSHTCRVTFRLPAEEKTDRNTSNIKKNRHWNDKKNVYKSAL